MLGLTETNWNSIAIISLGIGQFVFIYWIKLVERRLTLLREEMLALIALASELPKR